MALEDEPFNLNSHAFIFHPSAFILAFAPAVWYENFCYRALPLRGDPDPMREPTEERRNARRFRVRLDLRTILMATHVTPDGEEQVLTFLAYTRDISETGLALIVTGQVASLLAPLGETYKLQLVLSLPRGSIELEARPVRYASFDRNDSAPHTLIGAQITELSDDGRTRLNEYLKSLMPDGQDSPASSSPVPE